MKPTLTIPAARRALALAATVLLVSCASGGTTTSESGSGPVVMSPAAYSTYQAYTSKADPLVFALSQDGKHAYFYHCLAIKKDCDIERYVQPAIDRCTDRGGSRCYVFARRKAVVWRDPGDWKPATSG